MSQALTEFSYKKVEILSLDGKVRMDLTNSILFSDYYEDILSPCITMTIQIILFSMECQFVVAKKL